MEALKHHNPGRASSTRARAGSTAPPSRCPSPRTPRRTRAGLYEISNLTAEKIIEVYDARPRHPVVAPPPHEHLRTARPDAALALRRRELVRALALDGQPMQVFGDGTIKRDFLYVDDCVEAILLAAASDAARGEILNVGWTIADDVPGARRDAARASRATPWDYAPVLRRAKGAGAGGLLSDISKIRRLLGWSPRHAPRRRASTGRSTSIAVNKAATGRVDGHDAPRLPSAPAG